MTQNITLVLLFLVIYTNFLSSSVESSSINPLSITIPRQSKQQEFDKNKCPKIYSKVFNGCVPYANKLAGTYIKYTPDGPVSNVQCVQACCDTINCNVVFMYEADEGLDCFFIECDSNEKCRPRNDKNIQHHVSMVLIRPVGDIASWDTVIDDRVPADVTDFDRFNYDSISPDFMFDESTIYNRKSCLSDTSCDDNEYCDSPDRNQYGGICKCRGGYERDKENGVCHSLDESDMRSSGSNLVNNFIRSQTMNTKTHPILSSVYSEGGSSPIISDVQLSSSKLLTVSVLSKVVKLPENEVELASYVVPVQKDEPYQYQWTLMSSPVGGDGTTMVDQNKSTLKLKGLIQGVYVFRVNVTSKHVWGNATGTITVLPKDRINQPPKAIIIPSSLTVKLPNTIAVLDGTPSTDDDHIISYRWELQQGPLEYKPPLLMNVPLLKLDNLNITGNYTFKLSVQDSNHVINSTTANITVTKVPDYPPEANAGPDVIVYLPNNHVILNGNLSTDDHGLVAWEWTLKESTQHKAVDMQKSKSPYLQLSNLEMGTYTFVLKVTDSSNQSSSSDVHVFVKQPTNKPPKANGGGNYTVSLPITFVLLDATASVTQSEQKIINFTWVQKSGPNNIVFKQIVPLQPIEISSTTIPITTLAPKTKIPIAPNFGQKINATNLTKGTYKIELIVKDVNGNVAHDFVFIQVLQNINQAPKANAGDNMVLYLPQNYIALNGSNSRDDLKIVKYVWTRDPTSNALGDIIMNSDKEPVLILTNIVTGRYIFKLTVYDEQGLHTEDTVSVIVKEDPFMFAITELTLNIDANKITQTQVNNVLLKLNLLLSNNNNVIVRQWTMNINNKLTILYFLVNNTKSNELIKASNVVKIIRDKLVYNKNILDLDIYDLKTYICQNECSNHGKCIEETRNCICDNFWMHNIYNKVFLYYFYYNDDQIYNIMYDDSCEWSILYVIIFILLFFILSLFIVFLICARCFNNKNIRIRMRSSSSNNNANRYKYNNIYNDDFTNGGSHIPMNSFLDDDDDDDEYDYSTNDENVVFDKNCLLKLNGGPNKYKKIATKS